MKATIAAFDGAHAEIARLRSTRARMRHSTPQTRVVIVDDHPLFLEAVAHTLDSANGFTVVGRATSGLQVEPVVARSNPDLVVLDLGIPGLDGLSCLSLLRERHPRVKVVILSGSDHGDTIERALSLGAAAYILKSIDPADIPAVLRQTIGGNVFVMAQGRPAGAPREDGDHRDLREQTGLTARELEILATVSRGLSNRAVGRELFLSDQTVKFHLNKIYRKLGVTNRTEATRIAYELGLAPELTATG
jgi:two-component system, NarL family, nitrate/nitrite response regulator NarL